MILVLFIVIFLFFLSPFLMLYYFFSQLPSQTISFLPKPTFLFSKLVEYFYFGQHNKQCKSEKK